MPDALFGSQDSLDRDDLAAALPEPTPEDPASLRDDIVDELADHLRLSLDRELVNTGDEATARRRVLDRFGDPRTVARKLWWDALKGRIMRNRLWNIGLALLLVATIGSVLLMANLLRSMQAAQAELMDANRAAQEALVRQLGELQRKMAPESSTANTQPFAVRVVSSVDKRPIAAECMALVEVPGRPKQPLQVIRRTDATGLADFGHLPRGIMRFTVQGDDGWGYEAAEMFLGPNIPAVEEVRYPDTSPQRTGSVRLHAPIPPEFDGLPLENLRFLAQLEGPREVLDGHEWWLGGRTNPDEARSLHKRTQFSVRFDAQGTALNVTEIGTHSAESGAENRELSSVPGRLPVGDYLVTSIAAFHADAMTQPEQRASVVMNSELSRRLQVEPQAVSPIKLPETMLGPLWLSIQSLPIWPRDRSIDLAVIPGDVGHGVESASDFAGATIHPYSGASPPRLKTGDHVSVKFDVFPKPDFAEIWPHGDSGVQSALTKPVCASCGLSRFMTSHRGCACWSTGFRRAGTRRWRPVRQDREWRKRRSAISRRSTASVARDRVKVSPGFSKPASPNSHRTTHPLRSIRFHLPRKTSDNAIRNATDPFAPMLSGNAHVRGVRA